jgi:hypothetical protein
MVIAEGHEERGRETAKKVTEREKYENCLIQRGPGRSIGDEEEEEY